MDDAERFRQLDEEERIYAPQELPVAEQGRVRADEGRVYRPLDEPPPAAPIANIGTAASGAMAPVWPEETAPPPEANDPDPDAA